MVAGLLILTMGMSGHQMLIKFPILNHIAAMDIGLIRILVGVGLHFTMGVGSKIRRGVGRGSQEANGRLHGWLGAKETTNWVGLPYNQTNNAITPVPLLRIGHLYQRNISMNLLGQTIGQMPKTIPICLTTRCFATPTQTIIMVQSEAT
jgi:hypothetical protein